MNRDTHTDQPLPTATDSAGIAAAGARAGSTPTAAAHLQARLRPLLSALLAQVRRLRDTPLQFDVDLAALADQQWDRCQAALPEPQRADPVDWPLVTSALDRLVALALAGGCADEGPSAAQRQLLQPEPPSDLAEPIGHTAHPNPPGDASPLGRWITRFDAFVRGVDPCGLEILELRLDGCTDREIAERLGAGRRLVAATVGFMHAAWSGTTCQE